MVHNLLPLYGSNVQGGIYYHTDALGTYTRAMALRDSCTPCPESPDTTRALHVYTRRFACERLRRGKCVQTHTAFRGLISNFRDLISKADQSGDRTPPSEIQ